MIGIDFHLNRTRQLELIFLFVSSDGALHFRFEVGMQRVGFFLVELEDGVRGLEGFEVFISVHQPQRVDRGSIAEMVLVSELEFPSGVAFAAETHEVHAKLRMGAEEIGTGGYGLFVIDDAVFVTAIDDEEVRDGFVAFAPVTDFRNPGRFFILQQLHCRTDCDCIEGVGVYSQSGIRLG